MNSQPNQKTTKIEKRIRLAGILAVLGLAVELVTLHWSHPTSFLFFLLLGGTLMGLGIIVYLFSLVSGDHRPAAE